MSEKLRFSVTYKTGMRIAFIVPTISKALKNVVQVGKLGTWNSCVQLNLF